MKSRKRGRPIGGLTVRQSMDFADIIYEKVREREQSGRAGGNVLFLFCDHCPGTGKAGGIHRSAAGTGRRPRKVEAGGKGNRG